MEWTIVVVGAGPVSAAVSRTIRDRFADVRFTVGGSATLIECSLRDQAALRALLTQLWKSGPRSSWWRTHPLPARGVPMPRSDRAVETRESNGSDGRSVSARERRWSWIWLLVGVALLPFANLQTLIPVAAWLAPVFLLRFSRSQRPLVGLPVLVLSMYGALLVCLRDGFFPVVDGPGYYLFIATLAVGGVIPFAVDRWLSVRLTGIPRTLVFPAAVTTAEWLFGPGGQSIRHRRQYRVLAVRFPAADPGGVRHGDLGPDLSDQLAGASREPALGEGLGGSGGQGARRAPRCHPRRGAALRRSTARFRGPGGRHRAGGRSRTRPEVV